MTRLVPFALVFSILVVACGDQRPRCGECGMFADAAPAWSTGATSSGGAVRFDTPKCLFARQLRAHDLRDVWVTEYYAQRHARADRTSFVVGSDLVGPMGRDLVPVDPAHVARFVAEHGGRSLPYEAIDARVLAGLTP